MSRDETAVWTSAGVETPPPGSNETSSPSAREIVLTFRSGPLRGRSFEFTGLRRITLGRSSECDVAVFDNEVSRQHCTITVGPESIVVKDLGSSNGTFVDGKRVGLATLESGAIVRLASIELRFEVADAAEQTVVGDRPGRLSARARELAQLEIPGYTLGRLLGEGATGVVFEARDDAGAAFAIKVFEGSETLARGERRRFLREAEMANALGHPNIVRIVAQGEVDERIFMVMELVRGENLRAAIARDGRLPLAKVLHMARQVGEALDHARELSIVHRDVKPDNILIREDGVAKLVDLGLAKPMLAAGRSGLTCVGEVLGTLAYMPPEQLECSATADHRADVYALGATIFHSLAGVTPFSAATHVEYFDRILRETPPVLALIRRDVPPALSALVARCLRKRPEERFQTAGEVARIASALLGDLEIRRTVA